MTFTIGKRTPIEIEIVFDESIERGIFNAEEERIEVNPVFWEENKEDLGKKITNHYKNYQKKIQVFTLEEFKKSVIRKYNLFLNKQIKAEEDAEKKQALLTKKENKDEVDIRDFLVPFSFEIVPEDDLYKGDRVLAFSFDGEETNSIFIFNLNTLYINRIEGARVFRRIDQEMSDFVIENSK